MRIAVVAPSGPITIDLADRVTGLAARLHPEVSLIFHPQCFFTHNHFAGTDAVRRQAFVEAANDPEIHAIWFARGGYGACRIAEDALPRLAPVARAKTYLGYSDAGYLLAGLDRQGIGAVAHGPMPRDLDRPCGDAAVSRALTWLARPDPGSAARAADQPALAFNLTVLSQLLGTSLEPDFTGRELLIEDVSEHLYRIDRSFFHVCANPAVQRAAGLRIGRFSEIPVNDPDFGQSVEEVARHWCARYDIRFLGDADIGHDAENKVVPFRHV